MMGPLGGKERSQKGGSIRKLRPNHTISTDIKLKTHPNAGFADNSIRTTKYTVLSFLPRNLFEQFHRFANIYFLFIQVLNWIPGITAFGKEIQLFPLVFVLGVTAVKDIYEDHRRSRSDKRVNNSLSRVYDRQTDRFVKTNWKDIHVGDIVHLSCNDSVPADMLLLRSSDESGLCYVETANLDGESNLKPRQVIKGYANKEFRPQEFTATIECDPPNHQIYKFNGNITEQNGQQIAINKDNLLLRDCVLKNTDYVDGIVVYAGHETKAMLNNGGTRYKRSKLERCMNTDVIWCVVILLLLCLTGSIGYGFWLTSFDNPQKVLYMSEEEKESSPAWNGFLIFWTFIVLYQVIIPVSLYVSIELIKLGQIYHIHNDPHLFDNTNEKSVLCRALNITEDLGQIEYIFSDKTGTLTENRMVFRRCSIGGIDYYHRKAELMTDTSMSGSETSLTSVDESETFLLNPYLKQELSLMGQKLPSEEDAETHSMITYQLSDQNQKIQDFFILLAVCNSAVASRHPHKDSMTASGRYLNTPESNESPSIKKPITALLSVIPNLLSSPLRRHESRKSESRSPSPTPLRPIYESESPDEVALVTAAFRYDIKLLKRNADSVVVSLPAEGVINFEILNVLPFDSTRKKMSIILRHPMTKEIILYCKGSDSAILDSLAKTTDKEMLEMIETTQKQLNAYSCKGLRTLCMSKRVLTEDEYNNWNQLHKRAEKSIKNNEELVLESHNRVEQQLLLLGATGIEDSLQERVPEVISALRSAGIVVWVLTGDKVETAVNISYSCRLFNDDMKLIHLKVERKEESKRVLEDILKQFETEGVMEKPKAYQPFNWLLYAVLMGQKLESNGTIDPTIRMQRGLVVDGKTLSYILEKDSIGYFLEITKHCGSVLCCRSTPLQKASVVRSVKESLNVMTLAIGDGANDVSMIQTADVGIGISGQEGTQAVMASDFALPRFLFLERLLLVHGNWCYFRLSRVVLYFFYKNASCVFLIFFFQFYCGFSGSVMLDELYLMVVNALFTSFPPMILGIYDRDCPSHILLSKPHLYSRGRKSQMYTEYSFWVNMADAFYQAVVMFFISVLFYYDTGIGKDGFGTLLFSANVLVNLVHIGLEFRSWSILHLMAISFSILSFFAFAYVYNYLSLGGWFSSNPYMVIQNLSSDPLFWLTLMLIIVLAALPRCTIRVLQTSLTPSSITQALKYYKFKKEEKQPFLNNYPFKEQRTISAVWKRTLTPKVPKPDTKVSAETQTQQNITSKEK